MNRRGFVTAMAGMPLMFARRWPLPTTEDEQAAAGWHVLGPADVNFAQELVRRLSGDVFARVREVVKAQKFTIVSAQRMGDVGLDVPTGALLVTEQWNTSFVLHEGESMITALDSTRFRAQTEQWVSGPVLNPGVGIPTAEAFGKARVCGMPMLPQGVTFAAHFVDERSGFVMRAVAAYEVNIDALVMRWDAICG